MSKITFSVIIPYYNSIDLLRRLLDSISSSDEAEIIVINDHSTENRSEYEKLKEKYHGVIFGETPDGRKGPGAARNIGMDLSSGDWIIFADSDDIFLSDAWNIIRLYIDEDADVNFFSYTYDGSDEIAPDQSDNVRMIRKYLDDPVRTNEIRLRSCFYPVWSKIYKRSFLEHNRIRFEEVSQSEDILFSAQSGLLADRINVVNHSFYSVYRHDDSLSHASGRTDDVTRDRMYVKYHKTVKELLGKESKLLGWNWKTEILVMIRRFRVLLYGDK